MQMQKLHSSAVCGANREPKKGNPKISACEADSLGTGVQVNLCNFPDAPERVAEEASPSPHNPEPGTPNSVLGIFLKDKYRVSTKLQKERKRILVQAAVDNNFSS